MKDYYFLIRDKKTKKLTNIAMSRLDKNEDEVLKLCEKQNEGDAYFHNYELIKDEKMIEVAVLFQKYRATKSLDDIYDTLKEIVENVNDAIFVLNEIKEETKDLIK